VGEREKEREREREREKERERERRVREGCRLVNSACSSSSTQPVQQQSQTSHSKCCRKGLAALSLMG
jgi:hypothetical protein